MKTKMAGTALAAVMGACALVGGVERAEAYSVKATAVVDLNGSFDDGGNIVGGEYKAEQTGIFPIKNASIPASEVDLYYSGFNIYFEIYSNGFLNDDSFTANISLADYNGSILFFGYPRLYVKPGIYSTSVSGYDPQGSAIGASGTVTVTVSVVPLPASAPLLGAALMVLGGVGYMRRRAVPSYG